MIIFYFTGTGNSLYVAQRVAKETGASIISIPQVINEQREYSDDSIGFIYPQYANGMPKMVRKFIMNNTFNADYIFAINLWSFIHIGAIGEIAGIIPLDYGAYLKTPNNFSLLINPPKNPKKILDKTNKQLGNIIDHISKGKIKSIKPRIGEGNATRHFGECNFKVTDKCVLCKTCKEACPAENISVKDNNIVFGNSCETCFGCANLCPSHAIYSKEAMLKRRQYRNPYVSIKDIIEVNKIP